MQYPIKTTITGFRGLDILLGAISILILVFFTKGVLFTFLFIIGLSLEASSIAGYIIPAFLLIIFAFLIGFVLLPYYLFFKGQNRRRYFGIGWVYIGILYLLLTIGSELLKILSFL